jgi:uroporphyrinogen decarboxylase
MIMNSKERFLAICNHSTADRIPIDYLAHPAIDRELRIHFKAGSEQELLSELGSDFYYLSCRDISQNECCLPFYKGPKLQISEKERTCPFGIWFRRGAFAGKFAVDEAIKGPLENATSTQDVLKHNWPRASWFDFSGLVKEAEQNKNRVIIGGLWTGILGDSYRLIGFQNFLMNIAVAPDMVKTLVNRMTDVYLELNDNIFSLLKDKLDIWFFGNDFGSQENLLFSIDNFRDIFLENLKRLCTHAHSYNLKVMMHSCGAISRIIPYLVEAGVDILDPIQVTARDMQIPNLKKEFGDNIVFHGGIDTQQILPNALPDEVVSHCCYTIDVMGKNGGYIFAPSQLLQAGIPTENIVAMYTTAKTYKSK